MKSTLQLFLGHRNLSRPTRANLRRSAIQHAQQAVTSASYRRSYTSEHVYEHAATVQEPTPNLAWFGNRSHEAHSRRSEATQDTEAKDKENPVDKTTAQAADAACRPRIASSAVTRQPRVHRTLDKGIPISTTSRIKNEFPLAPDDAPAALQNVEIPEGTFVNYLYIQKHFHLPTAQEYPTAPAGLFTEGDMPNALRGLFVREGQKLNFEKSQHDGITHYKATAVLPDGPDTVTISAIGHGRRTVGAQQGACAYLLVKLHRAGYLETLMPLDVPRLDKEIYQKEKDAKEDVYNYSATYGLVPEFAVRRLKRQKPAGYEASIKLESQNIHVTARGQQVHLAEIAASIKFKEEAEKYAAIHGNGAVFRNVSSIIKLESIQAFVDFYRLTHRRSTFDVEVKETNRADGYSFEARALLDGTPVGSSVGDVRRNGAEKLAYLTAALELNREEPGLLEKFRDALNNNDGSILLPVAPINMNLNADLISMMDDALNNAAELGLPSTEETAAAEDDFQDKSRLRERMKLNPEEINVRNRILKQKLEIFMNNPALKAVRDARDSLPVTQYRETILDHIDNNLYSVIVGATGSGKTTQVPQILLDNAISHNSGASCQVICTQPRRIAATSVARRVADERAEFLQETVGYQVRFDAKLPPPGGSITYCTTGVLLQQLQRAPHEILDSISHILVDEVHERDILIDYLLLIIKQTVEARRAARKRVPKVVLMSATIDPKMFAKYFETKTSNGNILPCPSLSIPGRTFPVAEKYLDTMIEDLQEAYGDDLSKIFRLDKDTLRYLENEKIFKRDDNSDESIQNEATNGIIDWKRLEHASTQRPFTQETEDSLVPVALVAATVAHIAKTSDEGAILVFLPGYDEIEVVKELLETEKPLDVNFKDPEMFKISALHSSLSSANQADVFKSVPQGCRKIILSTNIAETSITIPDVRYVVDTGKYREKRYDQVRRITKLQCTWISQSNAKQRAGRAGRVQNGNYYALYSKNRYESLRAIGLPEMLRSDLQEICLDVKAQAFKMPIRDFLAAAIEPPSPTAVDASIQNLEALAALTEDEKLTPLGRLLATLPVHPSLGKMVVLGLIFRCLDPMVILGSLLNERPLFASSPEMRREAQEVHHGFSRGTGSDQLALLQAFLTVRRLESMVGYDEARDFCSQNLLHHGAYKVIQNTSYQIEEVLVEAGLIPRVDHSDHSDHVEGQVGHSSLNRNSKSIPLIKALMFSGLYPNLAVSRGAMLRTQRGKVMMHPSSLNYNRHAKIKDQEPVGDGYRSGTLFAYSSMHMANDGNRTLLRDTTIITPLMVALFGGHLTKRSGGVMKMDRWLSFYLDERNVDLANVNDLRRVMDVILAEAFRSLGADRTPGSTSPATSGGFVSFRGRSAKDGGPYSLPENELREAFVKDLVDILDCEAQSNQPDIEKELPHTRSATNFIVKEYGGKGKLFLAPVRDPAKRDTTDLGKYFFT